MGVVETAAALAQAKTVGLDLVEVAPNADPPVAKIVNWGKYLYQQTKQAQKAKRKHKTLAVKQMRFGLKIGDHDRDIKLKKVRQFLEAGDKVKVSIVYKGREMAHQELGYQLFDHLMELLGDLAVVDQPPELTGRFLTATLRKK